jgi:hypothetical protein
MRLEVGIDLREQLNQQIGTAVHISDGIHPYALRDLRESSSSLGRQRVPHLDLPLSENAFDYKPVGVN